MPRHGVGVSIPGGARSREVGGEGSVSGHGARMVGEPEGGVSNGIGRPQTTTYWERMVSAVRLRVEERRCDSGEARASE